MSNNQIRRQVRMYLHLKRCADKQSDYKPRYQQDAAFLNAVMFLVGITDQRPATWGQ
jgi:hypothetical protein